MIGRDEESAEAFGKRQAAARKTNWKACWSRMSFKDMVGYPLWEQQLHDIIEPAFGDLQSIFLYYISARLTYDGGHFSDRYGKREGHAERFVREQLPSGEVQSALAEYKTELTTWYEMNTGGRTHMSLRLWMDALNSGLLMTELRFGKRCAHAGRTAAASFWRHSPCVVTRDATSTFLIWQVHCAADGAASPLRLQLRVRRARARRVARRGGRARGAHWHGEVFPDRRAERWRQGARVHPEPHRESRRAEDHR